MKRRDLCAITLRGATLYEFKMQVRRPALWISFLLFALVSWGLGLTPRSDLISSGALNARLVADWSLSVQVFHPIALGLLLADRVPRDLRLGTVELLEALPASQGSRFLGKYLGATLATLVPLLLTWSTGVAHMVAGTGDPTILPLSIAAFLTINLPGLLFVAAFSVACPVILWVPLYQFLFVGYWFWGNLIPLGVPIPSLTGTLLTPIGEYMAAGFFGSDRTHHALDATPLEGVASMGLLLGLAALALACGFKLWRRQTNA